MLKDRSSHHNGFPVVDHRSTSGDEVRLRFLFFRALVHLLAVQEHKFVHMMSNENKLVACNGRKGNSKIRFLSSIRTYDLPRAHYAFEHQWLHV